MGMPAAQSNMIRPQQRPQPMQFQQMIQQLMAQRQQGLFGQQGQGARRFGPFAAQMQRMPEYQQVQQMARPMFQRPQAPQAAMPQGAAPAGASLFAPGQPNYPEGNWNGANFGQFFSGQGT